MGVRKNGPRRNRCSLMSCSSSSRITNLGTSSTVTRLRARDRIEHPAPAPELYFDFIESNAINAASKECSGLYVFGVTRPFLTTVPEVVTRLLARDAVWEVLRMTSNGSKEERAKAEQMLFD